MNHLGASSVCRCLPVTIFLLCLQLAPAPSHAADVSIRVQCDQPGHAVSPRLIGAFFEDINFAADGGLCAELVKNGSFETPNGMLGWKSSGDGVQATLERDAPVSAANPRFLRLASAQDAPSGGVVNEGFRRMGVKAGQRYQLSIKARSTAGQSASLRAILRASDGASLAQLEIPIVGSEWKPFEGSLSPSQTDSQATLELRLDSRGKVDVDNVSLCPEDTWQGRPHGLRKDIVQKLADLKPAFFRFPGGCIVEGSQLKYRYQWKTTIGPRDERRLLLNRWNTEFLHRPAPDYYQSFQLGFFEYFQLAEDLGSEPMPILGCGMACQFNSGELVPLEELGPYIQDALDLIEFANGPVTSEWGAKRAAMGHPAPFGMKMLGVGNEQWGQEYFDRYVRFAEVLSREHPEIELISTSGPFPSGERFDFAWPLLRKLAVPVVDEHCYAMPDWFLREASRFDHYDRNGPEIFMGEYAAQSVQIVSPENRNTLRCALAEAAFLTGIERNSDVVTMSAYAPLLAHEDAWQWRPNLIWFDNLTSYATPNYYVQQLFSSHRPDVVVPVEIEDSRPPATMGGRIGLGASSSAVEFRNLSVTSDKQSLLKSSDLSLDDLARYGGDWQVSSGVVRQQRSSEPARAMLGDFSWQDCDIAFQARKTGGSEGFVTYFRCGPGGSRIEWNVGGRGNRRHTLTGHLATHSDTPMRIAEAEGSVETGRWYDVRIELRGQRVRCFLDDTLIHNVDVPSPSIDRLFACAGLDQDTNETILKVVNPTDHPVKVDLELLGAAPVASRCVAVTLTGEPEGENSIASPVHISPSESSIAIESPTFSYEFPAQSFTVLRVPGKE